MKNAARITRSYVMRLHGTPEKIFPLLCPVREYEWIELWECDMIYTDSGYAENNCIFKTNFPSDLSEKTWIYNQYDPDRMIEFIIMNNDNVIRFSITLMPENDKTTLAEWKQVITALTPEGTVFIENMTQEKYNQDKKQLEDILNYFLINGKMKKAN